MNAAPVLAVAAGALAVAIARTRPADQAPDWTGSTWQDLPDDQAPDWTGSAWDGLPPAEVDQTNNVFEDAILTMDPRNYFPANVAPDQAARNVRAFLDALAMSEGTAGRGDDGYNVFFGGGTFDSYAAHPRRYFTFTNRAGQVLRTSAAGRYQFIAPTWDSLQKILGLPDFAPASQDRAAVELIREKGALLDVQAGRFASAIDKCRKVWASLPGAGYAQPERSFTQLLAAYQAAGGTTST